MKQLLTRSFHNAAKHQATIGHKNKGKKSKLPVSVRRTKKTKVAETPKKQMEYESLSGISMEQKTGEATCLTEEAFEKPEIQKEKPPKEGDWFGGTTVINEEWMQMNRKRPKSVPLKGKVKWEKIRSSNKVSKKPKWLGHNVMVNKIEQNFSLERASLPSVNNIPNPKNIL